MPLIADLMQVLFTPQQAKLLGTDEGGTFGTAPNYAAFDATGHLTFNGTARPWDDLRIEPVARSTGVNAPTFEKWFDDAPGTSRGVYLYSFDDVAAANEKEVYFTMQMPHGYGGGDLEMHVHWVGNFVDAAADPRWGLEYAWRGVGKTFGDTTIIYSTGVHYTDTGTDPDVASYVHYLSKFPTIASGALNNTISSVLIGRVFRNSSDAGDTYNVAGNKCGLLYIDAHFQIARIGSTDEYTP